MDQINALQKYMEQEANKSRNAAAVSGVGGAAGVGASVGAAPGTGGLSLLGLPPAVLMMLYGMYEHQRAGQMDSGAQAWGRTGLPNSPHDPGPVPGGGRQNY